MTTNIDDDTWRGKAFDEANRSALAAKASPLAVITPRSGPVRMLRLVQVLEMTGLGKTTIYELQKGGRFPMGVPMTSHSVRWVEDEVKAWVFNRARARPASTEE
jgi:prophage regulatory protein